MLLSIYIFKIGEPLPGEGYRERRVTRLAEGLSQRGHNVTWWTSDWCHQSFARRDQKLVEIAKERGFTLRMLSAISYTGNLSFRRLLHHWQFALKLKRHLGALAQDEKPDLVWCCFPTIPAAIITAAFCNTNAIPYIIDVRDLSPDIFLSRLRGPLKKIAHFCLAPVYRILTKVISNASGLVGVSQGYLDWAKSISKAAKNHSPQLQAVLPLGYRHTEYDSATLPPEFLKKVHAFSTSGNPELSIIFAGSFGSSYDLETLLAAYKQARQKGYTGNIAIAGGGASARKIESLCESIEGAHFFGWLSPEELACLLERCAIGAMAYSAAATQGLPNKIYEYLAHGLCILNSLKGEAADFITSNKVGFNYEAGNITALENKMLTMQSNLPDLQSKCHNAKTLFNEQFNEKATIKAMVEFCETVASRRSSYS